jgi:hypothetical protein
MPDNAQPGGIGDVYRTKDRAGVETQIVGLDVGIGTATEALLSAANPMPVNLASSAGNIPDVTGSLTVAAAATVTGAASTTGTGVIDIRNAGNASFHIASTGTAAGHVVVFEQTLDPTGALGWAPVPCVPEDGTSAPSATWTVAFPFTVGGVTYQARQFTTAMLGPALFRVRLATLGTGTILSYWLKGGPGFLEPQPALAPSSAVVGAVMPAGGTTFAGPTALTLTANTAATVAAADTTGQRKGVVIANRHASGDVLVTFNATATTGNDLYTIPAGGTLEVPQGFVNALISVISTVAAPIRYELAS